MGNTYNMSIAPDLAEIKGPGFNPATDSLENLQTYLYETRNYVKFLNYVGDFVESIPGNAGVLENISAAQVNAEADTALIDWNDGFQYVLSNDILFSNDVQTSDNDTSYTKVKEITCRFPATFRIAFGLSNDGNEQAVYGKIYKNGSPVGTERTTTSSAAVEFIEDLPFVLGDTIEIWSYTSNVSFAVEIENFRVLGIMQRFFENTLV